MGGVLSRFRGLKYNTLKRLIVSIFDKLFDGKTRQNDVNFTSILGHKIALKCQAKITQKSRNSASIIDTLTDTLKGIILNNINEKTIF